MKNKGSIYVLVNPAFPHLVKIGYADDVESRLKTLNSNSGIPADFHVYLTYEGVARLEDKRVHELIDIINPALRYNKKREFYEMTTEQAYNMFLSMATIHDCKDNLALNPLKDPYIDDIMSDLQEIKQKGSKASPLTFDMIKIAAGAELTYTEDDSVKVYVHEDLKHVIYNGEKISMSKLATKLLGAKYQVQGPLYFMYKGKRLTEIRKEMGV
jgi:hypothetical protein